MSTQTSHSPHVIAAGPARLAEQALGLDSPTNSTSLNHSLLQPPCKLARLVLAALLIGTKCDLL